MVTPGVADLETVKVLELGREIGDVAGEEGGGCGSAGAVLRGRETLGVVRGDGRGARVGTRAMAEKVVRFAAQVVFANR